MSSRWQKTIAKEVSFSGIGVHSGKYAFVSLSPASEDSGVVFQRTLKSGKVVRIPAKLSHVFDSKRSTTLASGEVFISTVEHVLAALNALEIDNVLVNVDAEEMPIGDGSAVVFSSLIEKAGIVNQNKKIKENCSIPYPVFSYHGTSFIAAFPSEEFRISYTLHYPESYIGTQYYSISVTPESFKKEISICRTFCLYKELCFLIEQGLIAGGCLENAVVIKDDGIISQGGLRFPDEPARHKILDIIGDLSLVGRPFLAHVVAVGSGHFSNIVLGKKILETFS